MDSCAPLTYKVATEQWEIDQVHKLNYKTFVEEIPQHESSMSDARVDPFHQDNTYVICLKDTSLIGMLAIRDKRPFSLDYKLENLDSYLESGRSICEIRLLAVMKEHRNGMVFRGLIKHAAEYCLSQGYNYAIISGLVDRLELYRRLGFVPFGPRIGTSDAMFQPMYLTLESFADSYKSYIPEIPRLEPHYFLPGPVSISEKARKAFAGRPISHRSTAFKTRFWQVKRRLCDLVNAEYVEILLGSGSLANDAVAGQISLIPARGLILSNGEFGDRLIDHGKRFKLSFLEHKIAWGELFNIQDIQEILDRNPDVGWVWVVHCESSTGVLNDIIALQRICGARNIRLCLDCISSIGTIPINLHNVYLASSVSGKGLGSFPGLSMVFYNHDIEAPSMTLPRYLDIGFYKVQEGIPFTHSSNLVDALYTALERFEAVTVFEPNAQLCLWLRNRLREMGFNLVAPEEYASPAIVSIIIPPPWKSGTVGKILQEHGYYLSFESKYLLERNWMQICLMGEYSQSTLIPLLELLDKLTFKNKNAHVLA